MERHALRVLARDRWRMAVSLSVVMVVIYFGFVLLIAFDKSFMSRLVMPGLSVGIVVGALVIVLTWAVTLFYVRWVSRHIDSRLTRSGAP